MATLNAKKTLAAVVLAAATFATPALAHAGNYSTISNRSFSRPVVVDTRLERLDRRIDYLRAERKDLKRALRYADSRREVRRLNNRLYDIECELDQLQIDRKLVKKSQLRNRSVRNRW